MRSALRPALIFFLLLPLPSLGQVDTADDWNTFDAYERIHNGGAVKDSTDTGVVELHQDALLDSLIDRYARCNQEHSGIQGYRIQLFFGEREKAEKLKKEFERKLGDEENAYIDYLAPNFRLRVGDFRTRIEAHRFLQKLGDGFGRSYIVRTRIELPDL